MIKSTVGHNPVSLFGPGGGRGELLPMFSITRNLTVICGRCQHITNTCKHLKKGYLYEQIKCSNSVAETLDRVVYTSLPSLVSDFLVNCQNQLFSNPRTIWVDSKPSSYPQIIVHF